MLGGNIQIERGKSYDTGLIYIDLAGVPRIIYRSYVDFGILPNATTIDIAHGIAAPALDPEFAEAHVIANNGTIGKKVEGEVDSTNVSITAAGDESAFTESVAVITYIKVGV